MLPVVAGPDETRKQILLYSLFLVPLSLLPVPLMLGGLLYGVVALVLGGMFLWYAVQVYRNRNGAQADRHAKKMFLFSIFYLFALFATLLVEHSTPLMIPLF